MGGLRAVKPSDLHRTYALQLYKAGKSLKAIQQLMGLSCDSLMSYIGDLGVDQLRPPDIYDLPDFE